MPNPEERELPERSGSPGPTTTPDTLVLQTLMDVERALGRLESSVAELERSIAQHSKDLNGLGKVVHTADNIIRISLGVIAAIAGPVLLYLYRHVTLVFSK